MSENVDGWKEEIEKLRNIIDSNETEIASLERKIRDLKEKLGWAENICSYLAGALLNYSKDKIGLYNE